MSYLHIVILLVAAIGLLATALVMQVITTKETLVVSEDFITELLNKKQIEIEQARIGFPFYLYLLLYLLAPSLVCIITWFFIKKAAPIMVMGVFALFIPELIIKALIANQNKKFDDRYARALEQLAASLRAGLTVFSAIEDVAKCPFVHEKMREKFMQMHSDLQMGLTIGEAFFRFAEGCPGKDASDIALAINIQAEVGGHEADVIQEIADNIHNRMMMKKEISTIFATTKIMVTFTDFLAPLIIFFVIISMPSYAACYFESAPMTIAFVAIVMMPLFGSFLNHRMISKIKKGI